MTNLSAHFTLEELILSQEALRKGLNNTPSQTVLENLTRLCETALEPAKALLGVVLHVDSGYRSEAVNTAVGGSKNSAHMEGRAADIVPKGVILRDAFDQIRASGIPYDQIIIECNAWIHIAVAPKDQDPRKIALIASGSPGHWLYTNA